MKESLSFTYRSIGNFLKLLATIQFEKSEDPGEITVWHECFDNDEADNLFEQFALELWPNGKTIQPEDVGAVVFRAKKYLDTNEKAKGIRNSYLKRTHENWVYFKPTNTVYPCKFAGHAGKVRDICAEFFKGFDDLDEEYLKRFILENFEIRSENSTVKSIAKDADYICRTILFSYHGKDEN